LDIHLPGPPQPHEGGFGPGRFVAGLLLCGVVLASVGCAVPQPRGQGVLQHLREPTTGRAYYLYLPKEYVAADEAGRKARIWPTVVTFHGMKPFDVAHSQAREWQQEADRYGFIVVAPVLNAFSVLREFPLRHVNRAFKSDEEAILAILNHVFRTTHADPNNVLSTSFSSGGYAAHYMLNRHPDRFSCLAVRQSNCSVKVLDAALTQRSLYHPILILSSQNDIGICKRESRQAIQWYESHGYKNFAWIYIRSLGHERTPDTAADFFASVAGVTPNRPPSVLVRRQAIDGNPAGLALLAGELGQMHRRPNANQAQANTESTNVDGPEKVAARPRTRRRPTMVAATGNAPAAPVDTAPPPPNPAGQPTPERGNRTAARRPDMQPLGIRLSSAIGFEPLLLVYSADCPADWYRTADFRWTLNGVDIGRGVNGQRTIAQPGDYLLRLLVVTSNGTEHVAARRIRVLKNIETTAARRREGPR